MARVLADIEDMEKLRARLKAIGSGKAALRVVAVQGVQEAKRLVPHATGHLGRTIRVGTVTDKSATVVAGGTAQVGYAIWIEEGTGLYGPHKKRIVPKTKKALAFPSKGLSAERFGAGKVKFRKSGRLTSASRRRYGNAAYAVVRSVRGRKATPYLFPGVKRALFKAGLKKAIVEAWDKAA